uniref:Sm domain-containing protein n=1 Tax=Panagrellus redivivus TaxID=6233 RepID=A0A7E4VPY7_PANRE
MVGKEVIVEFKNDFMLTGTLHSVDQYLNMKVTDISVHNPEKYPYMISVKNAFIRGSVIRYVHLPTESVNFPLLQDSTRKEIMNNRKEKKAPAAEA